MPSKVENLFSDLFIKCLKILLSNGNFRKYKILNLIFQLRPLLGKKGSNVGRGDCNFGCPDSFYFSFYITKSSSLLSLCCYHVCTVDSFSSSYFSILPLVFILLLHSFPGKTKSKQPCSITLYSQW